MFSSLTQQSINNDDDVVLTNNVLSQMSVETLRVNFSINTNSKWCYTSDRCLMDFLCSNNCRKKKKYMKHKNFLKRPKLILVEI